MAYSLWNETNLGDTDKKTQKKGTRDTPKGGYMCKKALHRGGKESHNTGNLKGDRNVGVHGMKGSEKGGGV